jgi:iron complex transport system ATP-binding protein
MIQIQNLSHRIGQALILRDISLTLPKGGITALIGPNGAGKSTLLSLIARLNPLQAGRITVDELDVCQTNSRTLAKRLAILPQIQDAAPRLSVRDLVSFGRYPHSRGRLSAEDHAIIEDALKTFHLTPLHNRALDTLSGGQRQKALLAMIFAQQTEYLLLDEPLNNLDIAGSRGLMQQLRQVSREQGRTIVIVLHDINYALAYADHLVAMADGTVVAQGRPADVVTERLLSRTYGTDAAILKQGGRVLVDVG